MAVPVRWPGAPLAAMATPVAAPSGLMDSARLGLVPVTTSAAAPNLTPSVPMQHRASLPVAANPTALMSLMAQSQTSYAVGRRASSPESAVQLAPSVVQTPYAAGRRASSPDGAVQMLPGAVQATPTFAPRETPYAHRHSLPVGELRMVLQEHSFAGNHSQVVRRVTDGQVSAKTPHVVRRFTDGRQPSEPAQQEKDQKTSAAEIDSNVQESTENNSTTRASTVAQTRTITPRRKYELEPPAFPTKLDVINHLRGEALRDSNGKSPLRPRSSIEHESGVSPTLRTSDWAKGDQVRPKSPRVNRPSAGMMMSRGLSPDESSTAVNSFWNENSRARVHSPKAACGIRPGLRERSTSPASKTSRRDNPLEFRNETCVPSLSEEKRIMVSNMKEEGIAPILIARIADTTVDVVNALPAPAPKTLNRGADIWTRAGERADSGAETPDADLDPEGFRHALRRHYEQQPAASLGKGLQRDPTDECLHHALPIQKRHYTPQNPSSPRGVNRTQAAPLARGLRNRTTEECLRELFGPRRGCRSPSPKTRSPPPWATDN